MIITSIVAMMLALGMVGCNNKTNERKSPNVNSKKKDELPKVELLGHYFPAVVNWIAVKKNFRPKEAYYLARLKDKDSVHVYEYTYSKSNWCTGDTSFGLNVKKHIQGKVPHDSLLVHASIYKMKFSIGEDDSTNRKLVNRGILYIWCQVPYHL